MKKVRIIATSSKDAYPTICGLHNFETLDEAINFAYYGAKGLGSNVSEVVVTFEFDKRFYPDTDIIIEIYDTYRE